MKNQNSDLFSTPVSLHIFNRPEYTRRVFNEIRKIKPRKLFITADGPRKDVKDDVRKCAESRSIVDEIDWDCELYKNFSDVNKGSFLSTSEGITWVFNNVDRAIILEDDCIPNNSFFLFCNELLDFYENDTRIAMISGNNFQEQKSHKLNKYSYYFSRYTHIWGWATWKRTWDKVDFSMKNWPEFNKSDNLRSIFNDTDAIKYWSNIFQKMYTKEMGMHWDYLLSLSTYMNNTLTVLPEVNLVTNIGFGENASNCRVKTRFHCIETQEIGFPISHPCCIVRDVNADDFTESQMFSGKIKKNKKNTLFSILVNDFLQNFLKILRFNNEKK